MKFVQKIITLTLALALISASAAQADNPTPHIASAETNISNEIFNIDEDKFFAADISEKPITLPTGAIEEKFGENSFIVYVPENPNTSDQDSNRVKRLSFGFGWGVYVYLNTGDQDKLINVGAVAYAGSICAGSRNRISCAAASELAHMAANKLRSRRCPERLEVSMRHGAKCVGYW